MAMGRRRRNYKEADLNFKTKTKKKVKKEGKLRCGKESPPPSLCHLEQPRPG